MPDEIEPKDNVERLLKHLEADSLAARLVQAHRAQHPQGPAASLKVVLTERLEQARAKLDAAAD